ncbi:MAG: hypothetical protein ACRD0P_06755 [Stackebrandtia sp.]
MTTKLSARIHIGWKRLREQPDAGYSTETVIVTAAMAALALVALAIIVAEVTAKAESIDLGMM